MVLINIESLSLNELRYIAKQENLEDWDTLDREGLIEELEDLYGDEQSRLGAVDSDTSLKFVNTLTDVKPDSTLSLPGVEKLPESYNETSIHIIMKDFNWAYVFWSLSALQTQEIETRGEHLILRNHRINASGEERAVYDIDVALTDSAWSVELPYPGYTYRVSLVAAGDGGERVICESTGIETTKSWFSQHPEAMNDERVYRKMFPSVIMKGGRITGNRQLAGLFEQMEAKE